MGENKFKKWFNQEVLAPDTRLHRILVASLFFCLAMVVLYSHLLLVPQEYRENQVVPYTIFAPVTFVYEDSQLLANLIGSLSGDQPVRRVDQKKTDQAVADLKSFQQDFEDLRRNLSRRGAEVATSNEMIDHLAKQYGMNQTVLDRLLHFDDEPLNKLFNKAHKLLTQEMDDGVTSVYVQTIRQRNLQDVMTHPENIYTYFLEPNFVEYIAPDTLEKRHTLAQISIEKGSVIVPEGGVVTIQIQEQLSALRQHLLEQNLYRYIGLGLLLLVMLTLWYFYLHQKHRTLLQAGNIAQLSGLFLAFLTIGLVIGRLPFNYFYYAVAFAVAALAAIIVLVYDGMFALYFSLGLALILSVALSFGANLTVYMLGSALLPSVILAPGCSRRQQVLFSFAMGLLNILLAATVILVSVHTLHWAVFVIAFIAGFGAAVLALGMLPVVETLTAQLTPGKLVELANPENELLRRLKREAHGTYVHSEMVADLTEEACKEIGADWLLAKVGALYHDIGKIKRPGFFAENIHDKSKNPHQQLPPETSVKILRDHVADGVQMAREARLPVELHQFIEQHHGSYTIRYFFHKANQLHDEAPDEHPAPKNEDYTYKGLRPQNRESAVVMLADVTEAVARAQGSVEPEQIREAVQNVIADKLKDEQLVDSGLTVGDLLHVKEAFCRILVAQRHSRVRYPDEKKPPVQFLFADTNEGGGSKAE